MFISLSTTIECVITALCLGVLLTFVASKFSGILQQSGYSGTKAVKWLKKKGNMYFERLALLSFLCLLSSAVVGLCFSFAGRWAAVVSLIPLAIFLILFICADKKIALRVPAVRTPRYKRQQAVLFLVCAIAAYIAVTLLNLADHVWGEKLFTVLKYCPLALLPVLLVPLTLLANLISKIYEVPHNRGFVKKAAKRIQGGKAKVVGITGSYGKTTQKVILAAMLSKKYKVLSTPRSHNTPAGIALTVNNSDYENYDVFIAEMGARNVGDIAELCAICPPEYAVITGVCPQHLETFGSVENIIKAKGEILSSPCKKAFISPDCADSFSGYAVQKGDIAAVSDIVADCGGTQFTLTIGGESRRVKTKLLGEHCAHNIALAASVAYEMGVSLDDIAAAAGELEFVEHRLQLIKSGGVNIIDDAYNANVKGARAALDVLHMFGGKKVAVTPGLVELGVLEKSENEQLGAMLAGLDWVILVGDTLIAPVKEGYIAAGGDMEKLVVKGTLKDAQAELEGKLQPGDAVLFLNDLPDVY